MPKPYVEFINEVRQINYLRGIERVLWWDQQTYMPPEGTIDRSLQLATLSIVIHERLTSERMALLLKILGDESMQEDLTPEQIANIREMKWEYTRAASVPTELVETIAKVRSTATRVWTEAREKSDYAMFLPYVEQMLELRLKEAEHIGYDEVPYDAHLDAYETGLKSSRVSELFSGLRTKLVPIVNKIVDSGISPDTSFLSNGYPVDIQKEFNYQVAKELGFDFERGRLDETTHPFTSGTLHDTRITTRFNEKDPRPALFATIHETGHGLYQLGFQEDHFGTPMAQPVSYGIHESQSRSWENLLGRSLPFWRYFYPKLVSKFPKQLKGYDIEAFYAAINDVRPSLIRVESDEVTYNLHIIVRYEIESMLFSGDLSPKDAPQVWNEKMHDYLGVEVPNDTKGILQDIHWSLGSFGYFPSYSLGNLYASQIFAQCRKDIPDIHEQFEKGDFLTFLDWSRTNIHQYGRLHRAEDLIKKVTGKPLDTDIFISYLKEKFGPLYGF